MARLAGHGLAFDLPRGWDGAISRRTDVRALPVLHASSVPLPTDRGDSGGGVVEKLGWEEVFLCLLEHESSCAGTPLFASKGLPLPLSPDWFSPRVLQGMRPVQSGVQRFFSVNGRAFCLFVVVGEHARRHRLVTAANGVLSTLVVGPLEPPA